MAECRPCQAPRPGGAFVVSGAAVGGRRYDPGTVSRATGGTMRRTTTAVLAAACLALAGCSSGGEPEKETVTVTATPKLSTAEKRQACVDGWAKLLDEHADEFDTSSMEGPNLDEPAECKHVPGESHLDMYMDGLKKRNDAARKPLDDCLADPACTSVPVR